MTETMSFPLRDVLTVATGKWLSTSTDGPGAIIKWMTDLPDVPAVLVRECVAGIMLDICRQCPHLWDIAPLGKVDVDPFLKEISEKYGDSIQLDRLPEDTRKKVREFYDTMIPEDKHIKWA